MQEGIIHTHQLTQYVIENFQVTGKVFLVGLSMGGQIALMLTHKYPDLYAGVLDVCGNKDTAAFYNFWRELSNLPKDVSVIKAYLSGPPAYLPESFFSTVTDAIPESAKNNVLPDVEAECGGTPESKPQAYDRISPTCHPEIKVPVISMIALGDRIVPVEHFNDYYDAVQAAGSIEHYRCYKINSIHGGPIMINAVPTYFQELYNWAVNGDVPDPTPKPYP
jgi:pimeloyl-ACP methyl ester carboxylesterase